MSKPPRVCVRIIVQRNGTSEKPSLEFMICLLIWRRTDGSIRNVIWHVSVSDIDRRRQQFFSLPLLTNCRAEREHKSREPENSSVSHSWWLMNVEPHTAWSDEENENSKVAKIVYYIPRRKIINHQESKSRRSLNFPQRQATEEENTKVDKQIVFYFSTSQWLARISVKPPFLLCWFFHRKLCVCAVVRTNVQLTQRQSKQKSITIFSLEKQYQVRKEEKLQLKTANTNNLSNFRLLRLPSLFALLPTVIRKFSIDVERRSPWSALTLFYPSVCLLCQVIYYIFTGPNTEESKKEKNRRRKVIYLDLIHTHFIP